MLHRKIYIIVFVAAALLISTFGIILSTNKKSSEEEVSYISASWSYNYADIKEITKASDLIALVRVNKLISEIEEYGLPFSTFEVEVIEPVYGCELGDNISIYMTGGHDENRKLEIEDDPLLESGQEFLVFLQHNQDGTYTILGGPQGRLEYKDKRLNSMQYVNDRLKQYHSGMNINIQEEDAELFINDIKKVKGNL